MEIPARLPAPTTRVRIVHTNDVHGALSPVPDRVVLGRPAELGGSAYLASLARTAREEDPGRTLVLDAGDAVHGQIATDLDQGQAMVEVMNAVGYNGATLGNHDFQWGVPALLKRLELAEYPVLVGNVVREDGTPLPGTEPRRVFDLDGVKVGVTGLLTPETGQKARADRVAGVKFLDEAGCLRQQVDALRAEGADLVVVLSHRGLEEDQALARRFPGEGLVFVGGHSHDRVSAPLEVEGNYVVQAGSDGREAGDLEVELRGRRIVSVEHRLLAVDPATVKPDPEVAALVARYEDRAEREMGRTLNTLPERFTRSNHVDSPVGRLVTDAMREAAGADLAFLNSGGLRKDLEAGPLTPRNLYALMPFNGDLMKGTLTGAQVLGALEQSVSQRSTEGADETSFLQVSGLRFAYDASRPAGERVLGVEVAGRPLDPEARYTVALDDYLAQGKIGYGNFRDGGWQPTGRDMLGPLVDFAERADLARPQPARILDQTPR